MTGRPILTANAMRAAEQAAIDGGTSVETLMERAGAALAEAVYRFAGPTPALILCGPGNNGGDGYVAARYLAGRGVEVRVAALARTIVGCGQMGSLAMEGGRRDSLRGNYRRCAAADRLPVRNGAEARS